MSQGERPALRPEGLISRVELCCSRLGEIQSELATLSRAAQQHKIEGANLLSRASSRAREAALICVSARHELELGTEAVGMDINDPDLSERTSRAHNRKRRRSVDN